MGETMEKYDAPEQQVTPKEALQHLQHEVVDQHGGITSVESKIAGAPDTWKAYFSRSTLNILHTPAKGVPYLLLPKGIDVNALVFDAQGKAQLTIKTNQDKKPQRRTCTITKVGEKATLSIEPFVKPFPLDIDLTGAFAGMQVKHRDGLLQIADAQGVDLAQLPIDTNKLALPEQNNTISVIVTNPDFEGTYHVTMTRAEGHLIVNALRDDPNKLTIAPSIANAPTNRSLYIANNRLHILVKEKGMVPYFLHTGWQIDRTTLTHFNGTVSVALHHQGERQQLVVSNDLGTINARLVKHDFSADVLDTKALNVPGATLEKTDSTIQITIAGQETLTLTNDDYAEALLNGKPLIVPVWNGKKRYDVTLTGSGNKIIATGKEVTQGLRGVRPAIMLNEDERMLSATEKETMGARTAHQEKEIVSIHNAKGEIIRSTKAIDKDIPFAGTDAVGGTEKLSQQRIQGKLRTIFLTNEQGWGNVDIIPEVPQITTVEIAPPTEWKVAVDQQAYKLTFTHPTLPEQILDLTQSPRQNLSLHSGVAQGMLIDQEGKEIAYIDACNTDGKLVINALPPTAGKEGKNTTQKNKKSGIEFQQESDIVTIYDRTPPYRKDKEISQYKSSIQVIGGNTQDRLYLTYDNDTNGFGVTFQDRFMGKDILNPDEPLFDLNLPKHREGTTGTWPYTDALWGATWQVKVTMDAKRVLRVEVTPPKNIGQLIEKQQMPKIDWSFPELGDAFKRITSPEQLKKAREKFAELIGKIGEIDDDAKDLSPVVKEPILVENEPIDYIDRTVYPLGGIDPDVVKNLYAMRFKNNIINVNLDQWGFDKTMCNIDASTCKDNMTYTINGVNGDWKVKTAIDKKIINGVEKRILRISVKPPQAWIDGRDASHTDVVETPGKPFLRPVDNLRAPITGDFGELRKKSSGGRRRHQGIDIDVNYVPVKASMEGRVKLVGHDANGYGNYVVLEHRVGNKKYLTLYGHLKSISVANDQRISRGQAIGVSGNTGSSSGAHLHFEVRIYDASYKKDFLKSWRPVDPLHVTNRARTSSVAPRTTPRPNNVPNPAPNVPNPTPNVPNPAPEPIPQKNTIPASEQFNEGNTPFILLPASEQRVVSFGTNASVNIERYMRILEPIGGGMSKLPKAWRLRRANGEAFIFDTTTNTKLVKLDAGQFFSKIINNTLQGDTTQPLSINGKKWDAQFTVDTNHVLTVKLKQR